MKIIAGSITLLAAAWLAQPVVASLYEKNEYSKLAAQCWSGNAKASAASLSRRLLLDQIEVFIRTGAASTITREQLDGNLTLTIGVPSVESVLASSGGVECNAPLSVKYKDGSADGVVTFHIRRSEAEQNVTMRGTEITPIFSQLNQSLSNSKGKP